MSEKIALSQVVAANVRRWRMGRGLDQPGLAQRLADLGWSVDRTTLNRIENGKRKVTVDDLGALAAALNVPLPLLLLPVYDDAAVQLTPEGTPPINAWMLWEWMRGMDSLPGRHSDGEWNLSAAVFWRYEAVRDAQLDLHRAWPRREHDPDGYVDALQKLVDALDEMEQSGLPVTGLMAEEYAADVERLGITPTPKGVRYPSLVELRMRGVEIGEH